MSCTAQRQYLTLLFLYLSGFALSLARKIRSVPDRQSHKLTGARIRFALCKDIEGLV